MKQIIPPVAKDLIASELTDDKYIRKTNYGGNILYLFRHQEAPNLMREVGRLRELTFRNAGGGTGEEVDIDEFDISDDPYHQLIVWDPVHHDILGGYRVYIPKPGVKGHDLVKRLSTSHLFNFTDKFIEEYMPYMIELGRSFVQPAYQSSARARRGIYALDNLWDGLGALMVDHPEMKYFFGKVTMYTHFNKDARNLILFFLRKYFPDNEQLLSPIKPLDLGWNEIELAKIFHGSNYHEDYKILQKIVRSYKESIPPLINAYMNLSPSMKVFGTTLNSEFGNVEETGIMITNKDLYLPKIERHVSTYQRVRHYLKRDKLLEL
jgi:hypothetical protein